MNKWTRYDAQFVADGQRVRRMFELALRTVLASITVVILTRRPVPIMLPLARVRLSHDLVGLIKDVILRLHDLVVVLKESKRLVTAFERIGRVYVA